MHAVFWIIMPGGLKKILRCGLSSKDMPMSGGQTSTIWPWANGGPWLPKGILRRWVLMPAGSEPSAMERKNLSAASPMSHVGSRTGARISCYRIRASSFRRLGPEMMDQFASDQKDGGGIEYPQDEYGEYRERHGGRPEVG